MATGTTWSPVVNSLQLGQLVEIRDAPPPASKGSLFELDINGQCGQLTDYLPESDKFRIALISSGEVIEADPAWVCPAAEYRGPGSGGSEDGLDVVLGPRTANAALGDTLSEKLGEKGFCVLKIIQHAEERREAYGVLQDMAHRGELGRLAQEVEEGYLGKAGRAKVMWLDPDVTRLSPDSLIMKSNDNITSIAELLQLYSADCLGASIEERTPALVCLSMTDADEAEYEPPSATDQQIDEFYSTWSRGVLRVVHFLGPAAGKVELNTKSNAPVTGLEPVYNITASASTILVFREDTFEYMYEEPDIGEACWLQSFLLKPGPQWDMGELEGDMKVFETVGEGPPPPPPTANNLVSVVGISLQACGKMTDKNKEWAAYMAGCDGQLEMPFARFDYRPYYNDEVDMPQGTTFVKHFSVQDGIELFDNRCFEISNMESESMDPQCRQVLEVGFLSIHQIGITKKYCNTNPIHASVSVGCDKQEWLNMADVPRSVATNNQLAISANRFSYVFNLKGGSYVCDTACSSSLVASHLGKVNLLERRWDPLEFHLGMGTGMTLTVFSFIHSCAAHMLSPGGRCFTFNATANGYNRGDGTACMCMKAGEQEAQRMCFLRGTQIGQDGRSASMSAPNGPAQEKCVWGAIREAQMTPPESTVWECHGTGTSLGDPIEVGAVRKVQIKMKRLEPLMVASSKSNFGHLEGSAAAIAMNKCVCVVMKIVCAPTLHVKTLNPHLDHAAFDAIFITETNPYKYKQGHCQVSSFGVGGTNGHAIFWGESFKPPPDFRKLFNTKMRAAASQIIADGSDPSAWEFSGLPYDASGKEKYCVVYTRDPVTGEEEIRYEKAAEEYLPVEFYSITGTHNEWSEDRMMEGDVPGLYFFEVEMPDEDLLEFRILAEGDTQKVIAPEVNTSTKTTPILGPQADLTTSWTVRCSAGSTVRIEFFAPAPVEGVSMKSIMWMVLEE